MNDIFDFSHYRDYLVLKLDPPGKSKRGLKSQFAKAILCDAAYVSRLLEGSVQLSLEQALRANRFFNHIEEEAEFFLELVSFSRAGSKELKEYFEKRLKTLREKHLTLSKRIKNTEMLPEISQATYYSLWLYAAIDVATAIPSLQTVEALSAYFNVDTTTVREILSFLRQSHLVEPKEGRWVNTNRQVYLPSESPHIRKHHLNWRLKAMQLIEQTSSKNLHYSSVVSMSVTDFEKLKEHFIQSVSKAREIVKASKDEIVVSYGIDCFSLKNN